MATLHAQEMGTAQRYRTGVYDLEVLTLPRTYIPDVRIEQGRTTDIAIPRPGVLNVLMERPGPGAILRREGDELVWVIDLDPTATRTQLRLQPGAYQVTYRSGSARRTELTLIREVIIDSGRSTTVNF